MAPAWLVATDQPSPTLKRLAECRATARFPCRLPKGALDNGLRIFRRARVDHCIDQGNSNCATEIAHKVEQAAGIVDGGLRQVPEGKLRGRQNAKHDGGAAHQLRPEHFVKIRGLGLNGTHRESYSKQQEAKRGQKPFVDAPHQEGRKRGNEKLRHARHQHDLADLERVVRSHVGEKDGHQIDRSEEAHAEHKAEQTTDRKITIAKGAPADTGEVHPWLGASLIAISSAASATAPSAREITSRWRASSKEACPFGTVTDAARAATAPGKTLIRKSQCHENVSVIQPPTTGPTVGARTANTPPIMVASV